MKREWSIVQHKSEYVLREHVCEGAILEKNPTEGIGPWPVLLRAARRQ